MARPTKDSTPVNIKMDTEIFKMLEEYSKDAGQTKTIVIERAVKEYIEAHKQKWLLEPFTEDINKEITPI